MRSRISAIIYKYLYVAFALIVLLSSWNMSRTNAAAADQPIPKESIRLRILANSDTYQDQWVKRLIRDAVIQQMNGWVAEPQTIDQARAAVNAHLEDFRRLVLTELDQYGYHYSARVELGNVPFPTKMYGNSVYPAGDYEALRITLGGGQGQNWWCVLFPPLCFIDLIGGEAVPRKMDAQSLSIKESGRKTSDNGGQMSGSGGKHSLKPEVRFFLWDFFRGSVGAIKGLF